ncbi:MULTISPECIES: NUDIX hydrolase [Amycolatopsis]|uniref:ADP-ribose pyrophosphatase YjhB (NUDIX family) n=1 Tax=Amycolatopsis echigonensis TaxID=2576905 RepID=A0A2N3WLE8_9PSEU|nr:MULTISPECIES: NUDIX hydrolase [Amycolatopsis]MBB2500803.1 NUDIX hydrolase [Amycolatopsis echigonensis]MCG3751240.1 NUDIX hydrolase [Amycolatopsis sp. Poz14]PKV94704.1 ADP-ribose pyrophosphatase YjhB (NUDIX family) [Amycolatopsis niigatensis]
MGLDAKPVNLRCTGLILRDAHVLLCQRITDWVLPGGTQQDGESVGACVRREVREETGLAVTPTGVAFVLEATNSRYGQHLVEIVLHAETDDPDAEPHGVEDGLVPRFVRLEHVLSLELRPPIGGYLRGFHAGGAQRTAAYLGNVWRPAPAEARRSS